MNWIKSFLEKLNQYFISGKAQRDARIALEHVGAAMPYIDMAARIVTTLTPTGVDDVVWSLIRTRYPSLFDGQPKSEAELKATAFLVASDLLKARYPQLDTTIARAATQFAYIEHRSAK